MALEREAMEVIHRDYFLELIHIKLNYRLASQCMLLKFYGAKNSQVALQKYIIFIDCIFDCSKRTSLLLYGCAAWHHFPEDQPLSADRSHTKAYAIGA